LRESVRAAEVMRRLRDFFRTGEQYQTRTVSRSAELMAASAHPFSRPRHSSMRIDADTSDGRSLARATCCADRLQLEVVLRNLMSNAFDASSSLNGRRRQRRDPCRLIAVADGIVGEYA
jgi:two-component system sensor kinase FixL